ncbi:LexA family protein [Pseudanabaena sp. PCC 6802]|uniref:LexA family protein n=1 Tax=Pseudanabaena sp. PCC 6802 TaxID=118173 RepID=UPI0003672088|nr:S24 family peptidase [Pseudanabaena sp. PCC 6802]
MPINPSDIDFSILVEIPLFLCPVSAGQPSSTDDYVQSSIKVPAALGLLPETSFALVVAGDSMSGVGIVDRDIVFVNKSIEPVHGKIVVAAINGEQTIKRLYRRDGQVRLLPENPDYQPIAIHPEIDLIIQGVVIGMYRPY